jgi:hypothetical protein
MYRSSTSGHGEKLWRVVHGFCGFLPFLPLLLSEIVVCSLWGMKIDGLFCIVQAAYNIGGHIISANSIEQSIFCLRTPRVGRVCTLLSLSRRIYGLGQHCLGIVNNWTYISLWALSWCCFQIYCLRFLTWNLLVFSPVWRHHIVITKRTS